MSQTLIIIIVVIIVVILAFIWFMPSGSTPNETFTSDMNTSIENGNESLVEQPNISEETNSENCEYEESEVIENDNELIIDDNSVTFDEFSEKSKDIIKRKLKTRNQNKTPGYKFSSYNKGQRNQNSDSFLEYIDESNSLITPGYVSNDQFVGVADINEQKDQYAPYKNSGKQTDKYKVSEIFNSKNYLPNEKSANPDWFDIVPDAISVKNRHLINVSKPIGVNTVGCSLRNPSYDIRGSPPCPKYVVSPWMNSTIEPDTNLKSLC